VPEPYYPDPWDQVPVLPVVVPLGLLVVAVLLWRLHRRAALTFPRVVVGAAVAVYVAGVVANSLFPVFIGKSGVEPWWSSLNLVPLVNTDLDDMLENVAVFVPLGVLLPLVARTTSLPRVLLRGFLVSLAIEVLQLVNSVAANGGHASDVNDLLANTLGAAVGFGLFRAALLLPVLRRLARSATWPDPLPGGADGAARAEEAPICG
jgi:glycopeptide antibiotics resistance protein